ncbi:hypothetical protein N7463_000480 [Penicillium fimorum]|uniref:Uncharacterized protein n=1 Tax=Penicillium fimorum TaxID=1882269 RepID=A0A9W9Y608_9EURO|nr:hypothetical protein N7463_000480 [Penicillium fimorum]
MSIALLLGQRAVDLRWTTKVSPRMRNSLIWSSALSRGTTGFERAETIIGDHDDASFSPFVDDHMGSGPRILK